MHIYRIMFESRIFAGLIEQLQSEKLKQTFPHGPMTWMVMRRNAWMDIANWHIKKHNNYTKSELRAWMIINSRKKKRDQLENCQKYAYKLFWNVCTWLELVDQTFYGLIFCGQ